MSVPSSASGSPVARRVASSTRTEATSRNASRSSGALRSKVSNTGLPGSRPNIRPPNRNRGSTPFSRIGPRTRDPSHSARACQ